MANAGKYPQTCSPVAYIAVLSLCINRGRYSVFTFLVVFIAETSIAAEYIQAETTPPESAEQVPDPIDELFETVKPSDDARQRPGRNFFIDDSTLKFNFRTYQFDRENPDDTQTYTWAAGGELAYASGRWRDWLSLGGSLYTSQPLDAPEDQDGSGLLGPGQEPITVIGQAYLQFNKDTLAARLYRQDFQTPYLNRQDNRMIPNTFEAYVFVQDKQKMDWGMGHVTKMKQRNSDKFIPMSEVAGADGSDRGVTMLAGRYSVSEDINFGALTLYHWDIFNTLYAEINWGRQFSEQLDFKLGGQYSDQRSVGDERIGAFTTHSWGTKAVISIYNTIFTLAYTDTDTGAAIRSPFGGRPGYNSLMLADFDRAGEQAWRLGVSYNFNRLGAKGVSILVNIAEGRNAQDPATGQALPMHDELDVTFDYRPEQGVFKGLWLRLRYATLDIGARNNAVENFRAIVNYEWTFK